MTEISGFNQLQESPNYSSNKPDEIKDNSVMDENSFLRLFIESLKNQNPLEPMNQSEMMGQIVQFTMIENVTNMKKAVTDLLEQSKPANPISPYFGLVDKYVRVETEAGFDEGKVTSVGLQGTEVVVELDNGHEYDVSYLVGVANGEIDNK